MRIKAKDVKIGMIIKRDSQDVTCVGLNDHIQVDCMEYLGRTARGEDKVFDDTIVFLEKSTANSFIVKRNALIEIVK